MSQSQPTKLNIRPFQAADLPQMQDVRRRAFADIFRGFVAEVSPAVADGEFRHADRDQAAYLARAADDPALPAFVVLTEGDRVVGFCGYQYDPATGAGSIDLNAIDPACQNRGHGTRLIEHALDRLRDAGAWAASPPVLTLKYRAPARAAYRKAGFAGGLIPSMTLYRPVS